jgi:mono/diheme cytochrome c family protein
MFLAAATTQRAIGWVIFALAIVGFIVYVLFNLRAGKREVSSEIELAANRKPYLPDDELETKKLERSLLFALGMLALIAVGLPFYWLREPARQANADEGFDSRSTSRGATLYADQCQQCHGPGGAGGVREVALTDENGDFVAMVNWKAPALTAVLSRFEESEILQVLNHGRNGVMPAFGAPNGPFTTQQLDDLIHYMRSIQVSEDVLREDVEGGVRDGIRAELLAEGSDLALRQMQIDEMEDADAKAGAQERLDEAVDEAIETRLEEISDPDSPEFASVYGRLLFNNTAASGAYSCARCHTEGWSYDATEVMGLDGEPLIDSYLSGGGFMAPSLIDGLTVRKFPTAAQHEEFVSIGSADGAQYLSGIPSMGSGQMPGFGPRTDDELGVTWAAILTEEQIAAVVAYERSL